MIFFFSVSTDHVSIFILSVILVPFQRRRSLNESEMISLHQFLLEADALYPSCYSLCPSLRHEPSQSLESVLSHSCPDSVRHRTGRRNRRSTSLYIPRVSVVLAMKATAPNLSQLLLAY